MKKTLILNLIFMEEGNCCSLCRGDKEKIIGCCQHIQRVKYGHNIENRLGRNHTCSSTTPVAIEDDPSIMEEDMIANTTGVSRELVDFLEQNKESKLKITISIDEE